MKHADARASALMRLLQFFIRRETLTHTMPSPDSALKDFFKNNETFAALFNGFFFDNEIVIKADELEPDDTAYTDILLYWVLKINPKFIILCPSEKRYTTHWGIVLSFQ